MESTDLNQQLFNTLHGLIVNNLDYFSRGSMSNATCARYVTIFTVIREHLEFLETEIEKLRDIAHLYDLDESTPGNGFRSYISLTEIFLTKSITLCRSIVTKRESMFFRSEKYRRELESCASVFTGFRTGIEYLKKMMAHNKEGELFTPDGPLTGQELLDEYGSLDQRGFYGQYLGFYYCESMRRTMIGVSIVMASFSDLYQKNGGALIHAAASVLNGGKYSIYPELRARQIVHVAQNASIEFIKSFWALTETNFMKKVPSWLCASPAVNEELYVPSEILHIKRMQGGGIQEIPVPSSHLPRSPVRCRLISYLYRQGQVSKIKQFKAAVEPSPALLFHCHGGGFISQSPEAHEIYLRDWSRTLNVPILTVDYSLAPQAPFPRALEEVMQCYVWALQNAAQLGWTGERVCVAGDSAGGNLIMGMTLQTIDLGIRIPDSVFCAYTPLTLDLVPSPSRLLCVMDPLLPLGFMLSCLEAYAGNSSVDEDEIYESSPQNPPTPSRRRSVIQALDSGISLLKGLRNMDIEENEVVEMDEEEEEVVPILHSYRKKSVERGRRTSVVLDTSVLQSNDQEIFGSISPKASETVVPQAGNYAYSFIDDYVKGCSIEHSGEDQEEHLIYDLPSDLNITAHHKAVQAAKGYVSKVLGAITNNTIFGNPVAAAVNAATETATSKSQIPWFKESKQVLDKKFKKIRIITRNPYMSPILASEETLKSMPPVYFVCPSYDPLMDDSVMFSKKLKQAGRSVKLNFVDSLPHGFLNFQTFSKEAHEGSKVCLAQILEALGSAQTA